MRFVGKWPIIYRVRVRAAPVQPDNQQKEAIMAKTDEDVDAAIQFAIDAATEVGDDTDFTQEQSVEIWDGIAAHCVMRSQSITQEMGDD